MKQFLLFLLSVLLLTGCAAATNSPDTPVTSLPEDQMTPTTPEIPDYQPIPGDESLARRNVYINSTELLFRESYPLQISLGIKGDLPTPCHQLRVNISDPDADYKIFAEVYSVTDPTQTCVQVLKPFEQYVDLGTFPTGHYTVWVNGEMVGEFDT